MPAHACEFTVNGRNGGKKRDDPVTEREMDDRLVCAMVPELFRY